MPVFVKGSWVWYESASDSWLPLRMMSNNNGKVICKSQAEEEFAIDENVDLPLVNESSLVDIDNMVEMQDLSEAAILHNLRLRFAKDKIYTYISSILVSVNPFKHLPIYSPQIMEEYRVNLQQGQRMEPHVYALADSAFKQMTINHVNQSVIISGESGAGKTEATKLVLQYMAEMSGQSSEVEQQLLEANPIVEAFGNAKTVRNNNSSRFGKWIEVSFDSKNHIAGAKIVSYLLEQSRIVEPGAGERNYHIFYQICQGLSQEQREAWKIGSAEMFSVCGQCLTVEGTDDAREFKEMLHAMDVMRFSKAEQTELLRTTCAVMHLANIEFAGADKAQVTNMDVLSTAAMLLGVDKNALSTVLVSQMRSMGKDRVQTLLGKIAAEGNRDALCKAIYSNQFLGLVSRLNTTLSQPVDNPKIVGVLDIFGFEIFEVNRFEQFCINFANEKMQQHFNEHIFTMEQQEYKNDGVDVAHVSFVDNQECLDMIETGRNSVLAMCDDELKVPKSTDETLLARFNTAFKTHKHYEMSRKAEPKFGVRHYAGTVEYAIQGFLQKNLNKLSPDLADLIGKSNRKYVSGLAPDASNATVGSKFKTQLAELMAALKPTQPHFIRCIKSNTLKVSHTFDSGLVLRQLRYLGLKEVVKIRQLGYPVRRTHKEFADRYRVLAQDQNISEAKQLSKHILESTQQDAQHWRIGTTKVFVRNQVQKALELKRQHALTELASRLQSLAKAKSWRVRYLRLRIVEREMTNALTSEDSKLLDSLISRYEVLQLNLNPKLLEDCIRRRNYLIKRKAVERALRAAIKAKDVVLLRGALEQTKDVDMSYSDLPQKAQYLLDKLILLGKKQDQAIEERSLAAATEAVQLAEELGVATTTERQMVALMKQLENEAQVKSVLKQAMQSRDLNALRHALQVAMNHKSGTMVGNALQRALAAGLDSDPLVIEAMGLEKTLDREVTIAKMASELQAALDTEDLHILETTVKLANDAQMSEHVLFKKCQEKIALIHKTQAIGKLLLTAVSSKNLTQLEHAIQQAESNDMRTLSEYSSAVKTRNEILDALRRVKEAQEAADRARVAAEEKAAAAREEELRQGIIREETEREEETRLLQLSQQQEQAKLEEALDAVVAMGAIATEETIEVQAAIQERTQRDLIEEAWQSLQATMEANDAALLQASIERVTAVGLPRGMIYPEMFAKAKAQLKDLQAETGFREQELKEAELATKSELLPEAPPPEPADSKQPDSTPQAALVLEMSEYSKSDYELLKFPQLKSASDFVKNQIERGRAIEDKAQEKLGMLKYSKDALVTALTKVPNELEDKACQLFKTVQGFMGDRFYSFPDGLVCGLIEMVIHSPQLKNEAYVQVLKQLNNNPKKEGRQLGWVLFSLLAAHVAPDREFVMYVFHATTDSTLTLGFEDYAEYVRYNLQATLKRPLLEAKPGTPILSAETVAGFRTRSMKGAEVCIHILDGSSVQLNAKAWDSPAALASLAAKQLGFTDSETLALYEMRENSITHLEEQDCVLDFQLGWPEPEADEKTETTAAGPQKKKILNFFSKASAPKPKVVRPKFVLLRRLCPRPFGESFDLLLKRVMALQTSRDVSLSYIPVKDEEAVVLAAYGRRLSALPPAHPGAGNWSPLILDTCPSFLKVDKFPDKVSKKLMESMFSNKSNDTIINGFLGLVKELPLFGAQFFEVTNTADPQFSPSLILAINMKGVYLLKADTRVPEYYCALGSLLGWNCTPVLVVLVAKLERKTKTGVGKLTIRLNITNARVGREVCALLMDYCTLMLKTLKSEKKATSVSASLQAS